MKKLSELTKILDHIFGCNKARIDCFGKILISLFAVRTVNLSELAVGFASKTKIDSRYKRIQRFFRYFTIDYSILAQWIFKLFFSSESKLYLTIDRTNWFWGKAKINILLLGVAYEGATIPLFWNLLNKAGNATAKEHQDILERFVALFGKERIAGVLGDREFASGRLFQWLNQENIPFYIRIKEGAIVRIKRKSLFKAKKLFNSLNLKEQKIFPLGVEMFGQSVNLASSRSERGELMIVATNQYAKNAIPIYLRRWEVETFFFCLKGRGFRFEDTHMTQHERVSKLLALLAVGFCWAHKTGEWRNEKRPIKMKKHRNSRRPQNSFFRYGFDFIRDLILNPFKNTANFKNTLKTLIPIKILTPEDSL